MTSALSLGWFCLLRVYLTARSTLKDLTTEDTAQSEVVLTAKKQDTLCALWLKKFIVYSA